jgi:hypothetical protein
MRYSSTAIPAPWFPSSAFGQIKDCPIINGVVSLTPSGGVFEAPQAGGEHGLTPDVLASSSFASS